MTGPEGAPGPFLGSFWAQASTGALKGQRVAMAGLLPEMVGHRMAEDMPS